MTRSLRADAQANHDRLLEVAAAAFARSGADTSLKAIAADAGVGIGTLYRRFPTREDLIEAVYRTQTDRLAESAATLASSRPAIAALRAWMELFVDYMLTKQGMAEAMPGILASREGLRGHSREALHDAVRTLVAAGQAQGAVRSDVDPGDVLMATGGIALIAGHEDQRQLATRLITLLINGLLVPSVSPPPRPAGPDAVGAGCDRPSRGRGG